MALRWEWTDKMGYVEDRINTGFRFTIYKGNAEAIILYEDKENKTWQMHFFITGTEHHKNMVKDNCYSDFTIWYLNKKHKGTKKLAKMLIDAYQNIKWYEDESELPPF